jgi:hypothetical protein
MQAVLDAFCAETPEAIGAVVCDDEGETVVSALGAAVVPRDADVRAREHVPRSMTLHMPVGEFLVRLVGAEVCAVLRALDRTSRWGAAGPVRVVHLAYREVELLSRTLPEDYYLVVVLRHPRVVGAVRRRVEAAARVLARDILE